ncbi:Multidrug resistance-associated protein 4 [Clydaea vesicula]|uniref:Multidrug resistance-associated protein 4 n=1 Tax=Clydaea vesicula TaxID=447962 RepID=A0AAD5U0V7_9FUNG|nr:Multidrug resistance-associated protein 4 [Clydaea vesicula]
MASLNSEIANDGKSDAKFKAQKREDSSFFSKLSFQYLNQLLKEGLTKKLDLDSFPDIDSFNESKFLSESVMKNWNKQVLKNGKEEARLLKSLWKAFGSEYCKAGLCLLIESIVRVGQALITALFLDFFAIKYSSANLNYAILLALGLIMTQVIMVSINNVGFYLVSKLGMQVRVSLITLIYEKLLTLNVSHTSSTGLIVNLMSNDVQRFFPRSIQMGAECLIALKRIQNFLNLDNKDNLGTTLEDISIEVLRDHYSIKESEISNLVCVLNNASFIWKLDSFGKSHSGKDTVEILHDISITISTGMLYGVCGPGEMDCQYGFFARKKMVADRKLKIAYSSQTSWIFSGSIKDNITFGSVWDETWFNEVIIACAMDKDIDNLPDGVNTIVGERDQYIPMQIYIVSHNFSPSKTQLEIVLDDPLSAVDTKVGRHIFESCIKSLLLKTKNTGQYRRSPAAVILITHQLQYIPSCDHILILNQGRIESQGTFRQIVNFEHNNTTSSSFAKKMKNFLDGSKQQEDLTEPDRKIDIIEGTDAILNSQFLEDIEISKTEFMKEDSAIGNVSYTTYFTFLTGGVSHPILAALLLLYLLLGQAAGILSTYWLSVWSNQTIAQQNSSVVLNSAVLIGLVVSVLLRRYEAITRSPIYSEIPVTLEGLSTIRAFSSQNKAWLAVRMDAMAALFLVLVTFSSLLLKIYSDLSPGACGLILTYSITLVGLMQFAVRQSTEVENYMISAERVMEYTSLPSEADNVTDISPPPGWPSKGEVKVTNFSLKYEGADKRVLDDINIEISAGSKVGIVGRTGAGKSSFLQGLFRLIEPDSGRILIDGIDTSILGLKDLRSRISIIPQEPFCFKGTLRFNLDPFQNYTDDQLWKALEAVELKRSVELLPAKLETPVSEGGSERQLICLARAVLRNTKLIVMDEATSSVDLHTDALIQKVLRSDNFIFKNATVLTIAHRLNTVIDYDKIMVLDNGKLVEFGSPRELLGKDSTDPDAWFKRMVEEMGQEAASNLTKVVFSNDT